MIRTKGEAGTGDVIEAVKHTRMIKSEIAALQKMNEAQLKKYAKEQRTNLELVKAVRKAGKLPVVNFAAGGIATPADAALLIQMGCEGVFVGSGIFKSKNPAKRARAIVLAPAAVEDVDAAFTAAGDAKLDHAELNHVARRELDLARRLLLVHRDAVGAPHVFDAELAVVEEEPRVLGQRAPSVDANA